jgi:hypothetical protein
MTDLVERLRNVYKLRTNQVPLKDVIAICQEAADKIEELENRIDVLYERMDLMLND